MSNVREVVFIPAVVQQTVEDTTKNVKKKRVAGYARVSTDLEEQQTSYAAQVDHYTKYIKEKPKWEFVNVYTDEGISATNTKRREGFNQMIEDAMNGKIDLIITKSVSRFARNTVDSLVTVRKLKEKGVEIYFEKENIYTLDSKGELLITIMSSLAQEESRSISENVTWGQRKRFADGKVTLPYKQFLGYEKGDDGLPRIVESEAKIVRLIYKEFLNGKTPSYIAKYLTELKIPTPARKEKWKVSTVESILTNEKYKGDALLQKSFTVDFLTKKKKVNEGEIPQYYVNNSHPAIIQPEIFDLVQIEFQKRKSRTGRKSNAGIFSGKVICGDCGGIYGTKVWHSTSQYRRVILQCNDKFENEVKCKTPHFTEDELKEIFVQVFNDTIEEKELIISTLETIITDFTNTDAIEEKLKKLKEEEKQACEYIWLWVNENSRRVIDQQVYEEEYIKRAEKVKEIQHRISELANERILQLNRRKEAENSLKLISENNMLTEFDEELFTGLVESITVFEDRLVFEWKDGRRGEYGL